MEQKLDIENKWLKPFNILYYFLFAGFFNYSFMGSTMLYGEYLYKYFNDFVKIYDFLYEILLGLTIFTIIFLHKGVKEKIFPITMLVAVMLHDHFREFTTVLNLATFVMLVISAKGKSYKVIGIISLISGWSWIITSAIACKMGKVPDVVFGNRHSFGSIYMTDLACHFLTLMMVICVIRKGKLKIWEYGISLMLMAVNILYMKAKVGFLCLFILMAGTFYYQYIMPHSQVNIGVKRIYKKTCLFAILILAPLMLYLTATFTTDPDMFYNKIGVLDTIRARLMLGRQALDQYPITMWGVYVREKGNGGSTTGIVTDYFFLDISYIRLLFKEGVVILGIVIAMFVKLQKRLADSKCIYLMFVVLVFIIDCSIEHHIIELSYSLLPYLLYCNESVGKDSAVSPNQVQLFANMLPRFKSQSNKQI
ncbi:MAG: hypothetical protein J6U54_14050 [Clostridiales bacterium]|nr:hypothetical protein [Clostridiales bacterium]